MRDDYKHSYFLFFKNFLLFLFYSVIQTPIEIIPRFSPVYPVTRNREFFFLDLQIGVNFSTLFVINIFQPFFFLFAIIRKTEELIEREDKTVKEEDIFLPKRRKICQGRAHGGFSNSPC